VISINPQPFESAIFGGPVFSVQMPGDTSRSDIADMAGRIRALPDLRLVSARIDAGDADQAEWLEEAGFMAVETLITFVRPLDLPLPADTIGVEPAQPGDHEGAVEIGRIAFTSDRFHADGRLDRKAADRVKAEWVANGLAGRADSCLIVRHGGRPAGFILCMRRGEDAVIDLVAVRPDCQGKGFGRALVLGALDHYRGRAVRMSVGTQETNASSIGLYTGLGFVEARRSVTFHYVP
jgi:ribosomal protein S18 acetylase RimI-like enzyme